MKHKPRFDQLVAACHYEEGERQYEAIDAIKQYYPDRASKVFIELLDSPDMTVRFKAAKLLGEPGEKDIEVVAAALIKALDDSSYVVRSEALKSLIRLRYPSVQKYALLLLHSDSAWQVRSTAAEAVGF